MCEDDFDEFSTLLDAACGLLSRGTYVPNAGNTAMFFRSLQTYPIEVVRAAIEAHVKDPQRGRFVPMPADIIAQIEGFAEDDGRPGPEEAWALALSAADEDATVVWTSEMAWAWGLAKHVFDNGDEVGARMTFREAYNRRVDEARRQSMPAQWAVSLGHDQERRRLAVETAVEMGRLDPSALEDVPALPAPRSAPLLAFEGTKSPSQWRKHLRELADRMRNAPPAPITLNTADRDRTNALKAEASAKVQAYAASHGLPAGDEQSA